MLDRMLDSKEDGAAKGDVKTVWPASSSHLKVKLLFI